MGGQQDGRVGTRRQIRREITHIAQDAVERIDPEVDAPFFLRCARRLLGEQAPAFGDRGPIDRIGMPLLEVPVANEDRRRRHAILELFARLPPQRCPHCQKWICSEQQRE